MTNKDKKMITFGIILSIIISGIVIFFYSFSLNKNILLSIFSKLSFEKILFSAILMILSFVFDGIKHYIVFKSLNQKISLISSINSCFVTGYFSAVTPFSVGGQPFQIYYLNKKGIKSTYATQVVFLRLFEMILLMFLVDLTYIFILKNNVIGISRSIITLGLILTLLSSTVILFSILFPKIFIKILEVFKKSKFLNKFIKFEKLENWFIELDETIRYILKNHKLLIAIDFVMMFALLIFQSYVFYYSINIFTELNIPFLHFFSIVNIINAVAFLVPTPGASGSFEIIYSHVLSSFSKKPSLIVNGVLYFRFLSYYLVILIGTLVLIKFVKIKENN
ncbi:hypothetical protein Ob7_00605 [Thermosipho africanus Ob7]|uniref:lysylphosphatidylglycerol synthase transmembrane domain-containing protein n=1 Tax=Thermosipho africanus TaxID=2421 RepID=UPI000E0AB548|nr:lysylphosphatidylglycerol synthase transmembrane domain-containing protein [Thermosipho africanus]RDI92547.1 hypothetical protein Ob7_00605 [Thermosipho africanus Ob7]